MHPVVPMASSFTPAPPFTLSPSVAGFFDVAGSCVSPFSGSRGPIGGVFDGPFDAGWSPSSPPGSTFSYSVTGSGKDHYLMVTPPCVTVSSLPPTGCNFRSDSASSSGVTS